MASIFGKVLSKFFIKRKLPCYIISKEPHILMSYWLDFYKHREKICSTLSDSEPTYLIFQLGYHVEKIWRLEEVKRQFNEVTPLIANKNIKLIFLANSESERNLLEKSGFSTIYCNQNAFLDENKYKVLNTKKKYDALYLARITPIKRQELARKVTNLRLIGNYFEVEKDYFIERINELKNSKWKRKVWAFNVYKHMAEAHVGLCLSPEEGAMFVSAEYLLCGLPIVSTKSLGGRDVFFEQEFLRVTNDCPVEIQSAVQELKGLNINPHYIRFKTIQNFKKHRSNFIDLIQSIYDECGVKRSFANEWEKVFIHKMGLRTNVPFQIAKERTLTESHQMMNVVEAA